MKVSPVIGTPTIPQLSATGVSPEKLEKLKAIANGQPVPEAGTETEEEKKKKLGIPVIKMKTNANPTQVVEEEMPSPVEVAPEAETVKTDTDVQANAVVEDTQPLSPQFAALAKQRRALQVKERELVDKEKTLGAAQKAELISQLKSTPLKVLQEHGVTYDQLTNEILASQGGMAPEILSLKAELKALKEGVDKTLSDKEAAQETAVLKEIRRNIDKLIFSSDDYEFVRATHSQADVQRLIHETYKKTGEVLDEVEALKLVETELENEYRALSKLKKLQGKIPASEELKPQPQSGMKTLTNKDQARPVMDRRQRAILAAKGLLKR